MEDSAYGHLPECVVQMPVASFRDSILAFEFSGFLNNGVNTCASNDFCNFFLSQFFGQACRRNNKQEFKHGFSEDVISCSQFIKDIEGDLFNSIFEFGDFAGDYFVFPAEEFSGVSRGIVSDFVRVFEEETGDGFLLRFCRWWFFSVCYVFEVFDKQGIKEHNVVALRDKKVERIFFG